MVSAREVSYVCSDCNKKRTLRLNNVYHSRKLSGGLAIYNDYHLCVDRNYQPTLVSIDANFDVRGQKQGNVINKSNIFSLPSPNIKAKEVEFQHKDDIAEIFSYFKLESKVNKVNYILGTPSTNVKSISSHLDIYHINFEIQPSINKLINQINLSHRLDSMLTALEVGKNINLESISALVLFVTQRIYEPYDYIDQEIMLAIMASSLIWMRWSSERSLHYARRHAQRFLSEDEMKVVEKMLPLMRLGQNSLGEIQHKTNDELSTIVSLSFILELYGLIVPVYKEESILQGDINE